MHLILVLWSSYILCLPIFNEHSEFSYVNLENLPVGELTYETPNCNFRYACKAEQNANPYVKLAEIKNSRGTSIDQYVNTILDHTDITADMILTKAKDKDSWFYKEFIMDPVYMGRVHKMHAKLRSEYNDIELQMDENFEDLKAHFPHFARVLPIFSNLGNR